MIKNKLYLTDKDGDDVAEITFDNNKVYCIDKGYIVHNLTFDQIDELYNFIHRGETQDD